MNDCLEVIDNEASYIFTSRNYFIAGFFLRVLQNGMKELFPRICVNMNWCEPFVISRT